MPLPTPGKDDTTMLRPTCWQQVRPKFKRAYQWESLGQRYTMKQNLNLSITLFWLELLQWSTVNFRGSDVVWEQISRTFTNEH